MKFKAVWKPEATEIISQAAIAVLRDGGTEKATIKLTPTKFFFALTSRRRDQSESWLVVECAKALSSVLCESLRNNEIDLCIPAASLLMVLKYVAMSVFCAMRLTKRGQEPVLRFEFNFMDSGSALVVHDVPVEILRSELVWTEPVLVDPDCRLILSHPARKVAQYVDRLKQIGVPDVAVDIINRGSFFDVRLSGTCDSLKSSFLITQQQAAVPLGDDDPSITQVSLTVKGLSYILTKISGVPDSSRCVIMACDSRYVSTWTQLPGQVGGIASVAPGIILE